MRLSFGKNGVGPNKLGILRYALPYNGVFHIAARYHDIAYGRGGSEFDRERADKMFLTLMLAVSQNKLHRFMAGVYYHLVRKYGKYFFTYKKCITIG